MRGPTIHRILIMGCSRSGTTLLQSLMASHSRIHTFPETGVFLKAFGMRGKVLPWVPLGMTLGKERRALARLLYSRQDAPGMLPPLPSRTFSLGRSMAGVVGFLDALAAAYGKDVWLEKTPRHVFHARRIRRWVPGSICIHMVRRGEDVVASIVDRARRFPDRFSGQLDPSYGIRQWNRSMEATAKALEEPGHAVVVFERLLGDPRGTLKSLCGILGLAYESGMAMPADPGSFTDPSEHWKAQKAEAVKPAKSKFQGVFGEEARAMILRRLHTGLYEGLLERASAASGGVVRSGPAEPQPGSRG